MARPKREGNNCPCIPTSMSYHKPPVSPIHDLNIICSLLRCAFRDAPLPACHSLNLTRRRSGVTSGLYFRGEKMARCHSRRPQAMKSHRCSRSYLEHIKRSKRPKRRLSSTDLALDNVHYLPYWTRPSTSSPSCLGTNAVDYADHMVEFKLY